MSSVQKSIWQLSPEREREKKAIKLSSIKAQWHCTGDWSDINSSSCLPAMAREAHSSSELLRSVEHLTNCNLVSCRWHRESRFPYPAKRKNSSRSLTSLYLRPRHSSFHDAALRRYTSALDHRYSFANREVVQQLNEKLRRDVHWLSVALTQRIQSS